MRFSKTRFQNHCLIYVTNMMCADVYVCVCVFIVIIISKCVSYFQAPKNLSVVVVSYKSFSVFAVVVVPFYLSCYYFFKQLVQLCGMNDSLQYLIQRMNILHLTIIAYDYNVDHPYHPYDLLMVDFVIVVLIQYDIHQLHYS